MSLKARIEAVIYAAEEPVTLPQLASIFREEALASRAARLAPTADPESPSEAEVAVEIAPALEEIGSAEPEPGAESEANPEAAFESEPDAEASVAAPETLSRFEAPEPGSSPETSRAALAGSSPEEAAESPESEASVMRSESAAQNSADAELAVPDFEGEPQPFPNEPPEATTPGRENDPGLPPEAQRPDHADTPATNAREEVEQAPAPEPQADEEAPPETAAEDELPAPSEGAFTELASAGSFAPTEGAALTPEEEKRLARQRDREVRDELRRLIDELIAEYAAADRGIEIREIAGGFRMATRAEYHDAVRAFVRSLKPPMKLSLQALETLAVIAYKQPITAPEIGEIRGVDSGGVLGSLVARKLITTAGRKQVVGRPILYKTTREFLLRFGLRDLNELPSIEEFEKMASELAEPEEPAAEQIPFAQNAIAAIEENAEAADEALAGSESSGSFEESERTPTETAEESAEDPLPAGEPEVGAAATEPAEARAESQPDSAPQTEPTNESSEPQAGDGENPEPALAGAEMNPVQAAGPGDGDPPPPEEAVSQE